jgi:hypothetical protein
MISQVGRTSDGRDVVIGVYREYETNGLPLDVLLMLLDEKGITPCWISLYRESKRAGKKHSRIISQISSALQDSFGEKYRDEVITRLEALKDDPCLDVEIPWRGR